MMLGLGIWKASLTVRFWTVESNEGLLGLSSTRGPSCLALLRAVFLA